MMPYELWREAASQVLNAAAAIREAEANQPQRVGVACPRRPVSRSRKR